MFYLWHQHVWVQVVTLRQIRGVWRKSSLWLL
ncbi:hypothetical protein I314_05805, partial [Cryptococcus bacillisporus CA1873]